LFYKNFTIFNKKIMKKLLLIILLYTFVGYSQTTLPLIPQPKEIVINQGSFLLNATTIFIVNEKSNNEVALFNSFLQSKFNFQLQVKTSSKSPENAIDVYIQNPIDSVSEKYELEIKPKQITIKAVNNKGVFYAFQTLIQLLPIAKTNDIQIPCLTIKDEPKYAWRGMHLDVSRHFFPIDFIKKYIDYLAMYKMNTFHWHLTDDQGWRIQILKYPKLTEIGSIRKKSMIGHFSEHRFEEKEYSGFYTQEEINDVVAYAKKRHVTIVPEIEMPGHSLAAVTAYPEYSCTGGPFEVGTQWGGFDDVFCPKEETFTFIQDILKEVMMLFPSQYIHIGGDECNKVSWHKCPNCQALMHKKGLKDEMELQSYFIRRIEQFINANGRKIIGWDEILEGGLAPNAAVMSWRGTEGGISAAKDRHFVVMCPGSHCYFDHYQGDPKNEPVAIGGYTTVEKVYSYNPTPVELSAEESKYILGAQGNVWSEYIYTPKDVEYMAMPRMAALSEVVWGTSKPNDFANFQSRLVKHFEVLDQMKVNYSKSLFQITSSVSPSLTGKGILLNLKSVYGSNGIHYTTNGEAPTFKSNHYQNPIAISESLTLKAAYFDKESQKSIIMEQPFFITQSTGKKITLVNEPHQNYAIGGKFSLVDGVRGNMQKYSRDWLGFLGKDLNATIDLGTKKPVSKVTIDVLYNDGSWIHYPKSIEVLVSNDGKVFKSLQLISNEEIVSKNGMVDISFPSEECKFVKVIATKIDKIPDGFPGAGSNAWLFVDEIMVE
jgi:hexosaminidase